jgi:hypothetical protein
MQIPEITEQTDPISERFAKQEDRFQQQEADIAFMRVWLEKHKDAIGQFEWSLNERSICFYHGICWKANEDPKAIARAFGKNGWTRKKDSFTCGAINWHKEFDGVQLKIDEAEKVEFNPLENVRL